MWLQLLSAWSNQHNVNWIEQCNSLVLKIFVRWTIILRIRDKSIFLVLPTKRKLTTFGGLYWQGCGEKNILQINSCLTTTIGCVNFLNQWNHIWYNSCNQISHLIKFTIIHCYSPRSICFCTGQIGKLYGDVVGSTNSPLLK